MTEEGQDFTANLNPKSLEVAARMPSWNHRWPMPRSEAGFQFERLGYFCVDPDSQARQAGLQPHGGAERHVGENRKTQPGRAVAAKRGC